MPIINKGILSSRDAYLKQLGNDWPTAQVTTTSDVLEVSSNLYFTNTRAINALTIGTIQGDISASGNLVANGLIIRNIIVTDSVLLGSGGISGNIYTANVIETSGNLYYTNARVVTTVTPLLTTGNVIETSANLYFTTARARAAFTAGQNITIENGTISALTQSVVVNESDIITVLANTTSYTLSRNISDPKSILVINEGLIQIPTVDYTVSGITLTTTTQYPVGSNIEVRYFGVDSTTSGAYTSTLSISLNSFIGDGSNVNYQLNSNPSSTAYTIINIDGVEQLTTAYSLNGSLLTFSEPPSNGANIDVRVFGGIVGQPYNTRNYVGDGVTVNWPISTGFTENNILVFENGVAQVPSIDYTVSPTSNVVLTNATAANVNIQIRELGQTAANLVNSIQGMDVILGNITPKITGVYNIGSANLAYNKLYLTGSNSLILGNTIVSISGSTLTLSTAGTTTVVGASSGTDNISPFLLMGA